MSAGRRDFAHRCPDCLMWRPVCICVLVPRLETRTHLVLVLHQDELHKPTNTGRLAARCLPNSRTIVRGAHNPIDGAPLWPEGHQPLLLFPSEGAQPITAHAPAPTAHPRPVALIVPDGTWGQAARACRRLPALAQVPSVVIDAGGGSRYRLRTAPRAGQLCTLEAIARALDILEGAAGSTVRSALERILDVMVERTLWTRGALRAGEVTTGLPAAAIAAHGRRSP